MDKKVVLIFCFLVLVLVGCSKTEVTHADLENQYYQLKSKAESMNLPSSQLAELESKANQAQTLAKQGELQKAKEMLDDIERTLNQKTYSYSASNDNVKYSTQRHLISVPQPEGFTDEVWIKASIPHGQGPFPMILYAHGMSESNLVNCKSGNDVLGIDSREHFAEQGYLVIAIGYRTHGSHLATSGEYLYRDTKIWDTRALLTAAQWGVQSGHGNNQVVFMGSSMGTWPAFWAATNEQELEDLQQNLDIRGVVLAAESANHIANDYQTAEKYLAGETLAAIGSVRTAVVRIASQLRIESITNTNLRSGQLGTELKKYVTPLGLDVFEMGFLNPSDQSLTECKNNVGKVPSCSAPCKDASAKKWLKDNGFDFSTLTVDDLLTPKGREAIEYWNPPLSITPTSKDVQDNSWLQASHELSPAYTARGFAQNPPIVLHLLSPNDGHYSKEVLQIMQEKMTGLGVTEYTHLEIARDSQDKCGHLDYLFKERDCGYAQTVQKLHEMFSD